MPTIALCNLDFDNTDFERTMAAKAGFSITASPGRDPQAIIEGAHGAAGVETSYGQFTRKVFEALPQLKVVSRTGVGVDTVDLQAATDHGVVVCNVPGYATEVVSDHAIALTLDVLRRTNELDADLRAGTWDFARRRPLGQVRGRTFGIAGMGHIGRAAARKAAGLGFKVACWSHALAPGTTTPEGYPVMTLEGLLKTCDVVSFHTALTPETHHLLDADKLALMKPGAVVVNTSRGAVIDTVALARALEEGRLWGAGIDVFEEEPILPDDPLLKAPHTVLTPHCAYWSEESGVELRTRAMQHVIDVLEGRRPEDVVNPEVYGERQE